MIIKTSVEKEGFEGILFPGNGSKDKIVIVMSGSNGGRGPSGTSCWSYKGKDLAYAPYRSRTINIFKILKEEKELKLLTINSDKDVTEETIIPVEKINGPVLLISSKHDEVWPSYESALFIEDRLNSVSFPYEHKHVAFENMSHAVIVHLPWIYKLAFKSERDHTKECANDREKLKRELLAWINEVWK